MEGLTTARGMTEDIDLGQISHCRSASVEIRANGTAGGLSILKHKEFHRRGAEAKEDLMEFSPRTLPLCGPIHIDCELLANRINK